VPILFDAYLADSAAALLQDASLLSLIDALGEVIVPTIDDVWETLQRLMADLPEVAQVSQAGLYPGLANVNLGAVSNFTGPFELVAVMDGVLITVEDTGGHLGQRYLPTSQPVISHAGFLTFGDGTDWEDIQALSISARCYTPRVFHNASALSIVPTLGVHGTVQPWTKK